MLWKTVTPAAEQSCLSLCPFVCLSLCLSVLLLSLYLGNYKFDFDETWWKSWNLGPIDCIKISEKSIEWWRHYDVIYDIFDYNAKGENSLAKGDLTTTVYPSVNLTWRLQVRFENFIILI